MTGLEGQVRAGPLRLRWRLEPELLLRATAFPLALLDGFAGQTAVEAAERLDDAEQRRDRLADELLEGAWPRVVAEAERRYPHGDPAFKRLYRIRRALARRLPVPDGAVEGWGALADPQPLETWEAARRTAADLAESARSEWSRSLAAAREHLHDVIAGDRVSEAVFLSNPGFSAGGFASLLRHGPQGRRNARLRAHETTAHRYVQRLCAKCETTAFFGPVLYARLDPGAGEALRTRAAGRARTAVDAAAWVVDGLSQRLRSAADPADEPARRNPLFAEVADGVLRRCVDGREVRPPREVIALWRELDGVRAAGKAAARAGIDPGRVGEVLDAAGGLVVRGPEVPATELDQLAALARQDSPSGPARGLRALAERFASEPWPERAQRLADAERLCADHGVAARGGAGRHYADRTVLHEDRSSPLSEGVTLGAPVVGGIQAAIRDVLGLCLLGALLRREDAREVLGSALAGQPRPLGEMAAAELPDHRPRERALKETLAALVGGERDDSAEGGEPRVVALDPAALEAALASLWEMVPAGEAPMACLPGFDLMAAGARLEDADWVLSELHDDCSSVYGGFTAALHSDPDDLWEGFSERLRGLVDPDEMGTIVSRRRHKHVTPEPPGLSIELSGRSLRERSLTAPIAEVTVAADGSCLLHGQREVRLYPGDLASPLHRAVALPSLVPVSVDTGAFTPRIVIGATVYQRARWRVRLEPAADPFAWWRQAQRLRAAHGMPARMFLRHPQEPKPLLLDFSDPLGVEGIGRLPAGEVTLTEMLPDDGGLWWAPEGLGECAELRVGCLVTGEPAEGESA